MRKTARSNNKRTLRTDCLISNGSIAKKLFLSAPQFQRNNGLDVKRLREHIHRLDAFNLITLGDVGDVSCQSGWVAGNINNPGWLEFKEGIKESFVAALTRRIHK